jgi:hypothetical protein
MDWKDLGDWFRFSIDAHANHEHNVKLSRDVLRGQLASARKGSWIGAPPRGYIIEGPKGHKRLVAGHPDDVALVRRIFREYVDEGRSLNEIADRLDADKVPTVRRTKKRSGNPCPWRYDAVGAILSNPAYIGTFKFNRNSRAKYHSYQGGEYVAGKRHGPNAEADVIVIENCEMIDPLIDRDTFDRAQVLLSKGRTGRNGYTPDTNPFLLSGLLRCGDCGAPLWAYKGRQVKRYECSRQQETKDCPGGGCSIREDDLLRFLADELSNWIGPERDKLEIFAFKGWLTPEDEPNLPPAFADLKKLLSPKTPPASERKRLEKRRAQVTSDLAKANANLVLVEATRLLAFQQGMSKMEDELKQLDEAISNAKPPADKDLNAVALSVLYNLGNLANAFRSMALPSVMVTARYTDENGVVHTKEKRAVQNADGTITVGTLESLAPGEVRRFLHHLDHIAVHTKRLGEGRGTRHAFIGADLAFRPTGGVTGKSNVTRYGPIVIPLPLSRQQAG